MRDRLFLLGIVALCFGTRAGASEPAYEYKLKYDSQSDLCVHMETVFNGHFKRMWDIPMPIDEKLSIYDSQSQYAFPLLGGTTHVNSMTNLMMYSRVPTSPEFQAVPWFEGHASEAETIRNSLGEPVAFPFLIAYFDIDNDGIEDTVVKSSFTKGYNAIVAAGMSGDVGESIAVYHDKRIAIGANATLTELAGGSESFGKPDLIAGHLIRPIIYHGKSYVVTYSQGLFGRPTKRSRLNVNAGLPPMERMFISSYTFAGPNDATRRTKDSLTTLCVYDMNQVY
jgi:hypothetical protein